MEAIRKLEHRSIEFMREKEEKKQLEDQIKRLTSQMFVGQSHIGSLLNQNGGSSEAPSDQIRYCVYVDAYYRLTRQQS